MNKPTPVPLFNYRKRQRQALVSDPRQVLPQSNLHADQPTTSKEPESAPASFSQNKADKKYILPPPARMGCSNPSSSNKAYPSKARPGLMDMSRKFSGSNKVLPIMHGKTTTVGHDLNKSACLYNYGNQNTGRSFNNRGEGFNSYFGTQPSVGERNYIQGKESYSRTSINTSTPGSCGTGTFSSSASKQSIISQQRANSNTNRRSSLARHLSSGNSSKPFTFKSSFTSDMAGSTASNVTRAKNLAPRTNINYSPKKGRSQQSNIQGRSTQFAVDTSRDSGSLRKRTEEFVSEYGGKKSIFDEQRTQRQTQPAKVESYKKSTPDTSLRIFTCPIASLKSWMDLKVNTGPVMFEIYGLLDSATVKDLTRTGKEFVLRDDTDCIKCVFYEIDRELPRLTRGQVHRVVGHLDMRRGMLKVVSVRPAQHEERAVCQAASALSQAEMENLAGVNNEQ